MNRTKPSPMIVWIFIASLLIQGVGLAEDRSSASGPYFTISTRQIMDDAAGKTTDFPKYTTQLINIANQNSQATRPKNVGQMSELIQEFSGESYNEWVR